MKADIGLFSQATVELMIFPDFILKLKSTAAMSGKYLPFFFVCLFCSNNKELTNFKSGQCVQDMEGLCISFGKWNRDLNLHCVVNKGL